MITTIDEYYEQVMKHGTGPAKTLMTEEALMSATMAKKLKHQNLSVAEVQRELMCLLIAHRPQVLVNYMLERAEGIPIGKDGPVVVPKMP